MQSSRRANGVAALIVLVVAQSSVSMGSAIDGIKKSCVTSRYPEVCIKVISAAEREAVMDNPRMMAITAIDTAMQTTKKVLTTVKLVQKSRGMTPLELAASSDCVELLDQSLYELQNSLNEIKDTKNMDFKLMINDVQTWVSAALTDDMTCSDAFHSQLYADAAKPNIQEQVEYLIKLNSIALEFINMYAAFHS